MRFVLVIITVVVLFITFSIENDSGFSHWERPAQAKAIEMKDLVRYSDGSYDCRQYGNHLTVKPDYIPEDSFLATQCASAITGVPVEYIVAIHQIECNFGQSNAQDIRNKSKTCRDQGTKNGCSAAGAGQFIPQTWDKENRNGKCNRKAGEIREGDFGNLKAPARDRGVPGYGMDCDGDGIANPWSIYDSSCATAYYLATLSESYGGDWHSVFRHYNGGPRGDRSRTVPYADGVIRRAETFRSLI